MKRFLLCTATVLAMFGSISQADAKDPEDQEFRHVVVTLKSGKKVEGYLHRGWHAEGALHAIPDGSAETGELFVQNHQDAR